MQFGCCIPLDFYEAAADNGCDYVEFPVWQLSRITEAEAARLGERTRERGVLCTRMNSYAMGKPAIVGPAFSPQEVKSYAQDVCRKASHFNVDSICIGAPSARKIPAGYDYRQAEKQCIEFLKITAEEANPYGMLLSLEAVQKDMCNYLNVTEEAQRIVKDLGLPGIRLLVDLYHMETMQEDWNRLTGYLPDTCHLHVSTVKAGIHRGLYDEASREACRKAFRAIAAAGYDGTVSVEPDYEELTPAALARSMRIMKESWQEAQSRQD
ncbi:MAG: sugar phosphate isomerase/epimerase [Clostridia bacterium]|nr:sugar phosphate isomerase/epimerase [Clostridia bacterium]